MNLCPAASSTGLAVSLTGIAPETGIYVSAVNDGSFMVTRAGAATTGIDFNYFIITFVNLQIEIVEGESIAEVNPEG